MLIALSVSQQHVHADKACLSETYRCPGCQEKVILRRGQVNIPHFAHLKNEGCASFSEGETEEHLKGKVDLYNWLVGLNVPAQLEPYLSELQQRPDILAIIKGTKVAIEFQCSPISVESIEKRTKGYLSKGYKVIWIVGQKVNNKENFTSALKAYISENNGHYYVLHYNFNEKKIFVYSQIQSSRKKVIYKKTSFKIHSLLLQEVCDNLQCKNKTIKTYFNVEKEKKQLAMMSYQKQSQAREFFYLMYKNQESLQSIPLVVFAPLKDEWMIRSFSYQWKYAFLIWIEEQSNTRVLTSKMVIRLITEWNESGKINFHTIPNINQTAFHKPIFQFIDYLVSERVLEKIGTNKWKYIRKAKRTNNTL